MRQLPDQFFRLNNARRKQPNTCFFSRKIWTSLISIFSYPDFQQLRQFRFNNYTYSSCRFNLQGNVRLLIWIQQQFLNLFHRHITWRIFQNTGFLSPTLLLGENRWWQTPTCPKKPLRFFLKPKGPPSKRVLEGVGIWLFVSFPVFRSKVKDCKDLDVLVKGRKVGRVFWMMMMMMMMMIDLKWESLACHFVKHLYIAYSHRQWAQKGGIQGVHHWNRGFAKKTQKIL